jgi:hypothetical protein
MLSIENWLSNKMGDRGMPKYKADPEIGIVQLPAHRQGEGF